MDANMTLVIIEDFIIAHPLLYILVLILISAILTVMIKKLDFWGGLCIMTLIILIMDYASNRAGVSLVRLVYEFCEVIIEHFYNLF